MAGVGRAVTPLTLSERERTALTELVEHGQTSDALRLRCRIVLASADGLANIEVAEQLHVTAATVGKWRRRFVQMGLAGLDDRARSGRPRSAGRRADGPRADRAEDESSPAATAALSTRALAEAMGVSQSTASRRRREEHGHYRRVTPSGGGAPVGAVSEPPPAPTHQTPAPPTPRELLSDRVYDTIRSWILSGELAPGARVVESEIARILGTSQAPAREAVRRLAHEGLVTHRPRLGNFVTVISSVEAREAREVRVVLETAAARRAAGRLSPDELGTLRGEVQRMIEAAERKDIGAFRAADMRFHRQACAFSGNSMLLRIWRMLEATLWNLQVVSSAMYAGDWMAMALRHDDLVDALEDGDPAEAARLFSAHARGEHSITKPARGRHRD